MSYVLIFTVFIYIHFILELYLKLNKDRIIKNIKLNS